MPPQDTPNTTTGLVSGFGVFKFDLNIGQTCELVEPRDFLSDSTLRSMSMLCFPDSQSIASKSMTYDCLYYFTFNLPTPPHPHSSQTQSRSIVCYVYFKQVEDRTCSRGYYQKSFVILSSSPRVDEQLLSFARSIGNKYFIAESEGCGAEVLVDALNQFSHSSVSARSPSNGSLCLDPTQPSSARSRPLVDTSDLVSSFLDGLWHVWEALMVGLPILVYANGADVVCHLVTEISRLTSPFQFKGNMHPYLSIFDPEYKRLLKHVPSGAIVGVTSPMAYEQLRDSFPVLISLPTPDDDLVLASHVRIGSSVWISDSITSVSSGTRDRMTSLMRNWSPTATTDSSYRLVVRPEIDTLKSKLVVSNINSDEQLTKSINNGIIANYFSSLTRDFLIPFLAYIELDSSCLVRDVGSPTPLCAKFNHSLFMTNLVPVGYFGSLPQTKVEQVYGAFIRSNQFHAWLTRSQEKADLQSIQLHASLILKNFTKSPRIVERVHSLVALIQSSQSWHHKLENELKQLINLVAIP